MHLSSVEDCIKYYESEMNVLLRKYNQGKRIQENLKKHTFPGAINSTELLVSLFELSHTVTLCILAMEQAIIEQSTKITGQVVTWVKFDLLRSLYIFYNFCSLDNGTLNVQEKLQKSCASKFEKIQDINEKKTELRCGESQRKIEVMKILCFLHEQFVSSKLSSLLRRLYIQ